MLRIDVAIVPHGDDTREQVIDTLYIANVTPYNEIADYAVWSATHPTRKIVAAHRRTAGWMPLVRRAIEALS